MHRFVIADVFTDRPFSGNQLAVVPDARGLSDQAMQAIAHDFNFPESTFVLPQDRVRIFTPKSEMQFAGHPTVGTAAVLAHLRGLALPAELVLMEGIGPVPVELERRAALIHARFAIEKPVEVLSERPEHAHAAAALALPESAVKETWFASGGVRFAMIRLADRAAVDRAQLDRAAWLRHFKDAWASQLYFFTGDTEIYARMFAPALGIFEDPATGSAAVALGGVLGKPRLEIAQGVAMGRPSRLEVTFGNGRITVGGTTVIWAQGELLI
jgi:trans-2,3-dihydro-3-hydroxyanthranilate isomerase